MTTKVEYKGNLVCETTHIKNGAIILTDAPTDNNGKGEHFSPTDLFVSTLAQCSLTTIAIVGKDRGINIDGATCNVTKVMTQTPPRQIAEIICEFNFPAEYDDKSKRFIEGAVKVCPVGRSINTDIKQTHIYNYGEK